MIVFPVAAPVTVVLNGAPIRTYQPAFVVNGRTYAPPKPFLSRIADRLWCDGRVLMLERGGRTVRIALGGPVPLAPVLRALGAIVTYRDRTVIVSFLAARTIATPTPFDANGPAVTPRAVFTPLAVPTPRPVWSGVPLPRRTPLPITVPTRKPGG